MTELPDGLGSSDTESNY